MTLSLNTKSRLQRGLGSNTAANELEQFLGPVAGTTYFVDSTSSVDSDTTSRAGTSRDEPFSSLDYAIGRCTASKGDVIVLMPGHVETTTAIALDVAGVTIIGLGSGRLKPALTATTASTDLINVTAANCAIYNVRLVGAASGCTALLDVAADDFYAERVVFEHGAAPVSAVTVPGSFSRGKLVDCEWRGTAAGPDYCVYFENGATTGTIKDWQIIRARAQYAVSAGLDLAFVRADRKCPGLLIVDPIVIGFDTLVIDINSSTLAQGDGMLIGGASVSTASQTIANVHDVGGVSIIEHRVTDAVTAKGLVIPTATPD